MPSLMGEAEGEFELCAADAKAGAGMQAAAARAEAPRSRVRRSRFADMGSIVAVRREGCLWSGGLSGRI